jgi:hypothetical protein
MMALGARGDDHLTIGSGTLDEVAFYNGAALSAPRVSAHYAAGHVLTGICVASDACHVAGVWDVTAAACSDPIAPNDTVCAPGRACQEGVCTHISTGTYPEEIQADAPTGWWRLGDPAGSSTAADSSGHGFFGTVIGTFDFGAPGLVLGPDTSASMAGFGYVSVPNPPTNEFAPSGAFSVEAWVNPALPNTYIVEKYDTPGYRGYALRLIGGYAMLHVAQASSSTDLISSALVPLGMTHHLVGTVDATGMGTLYVDGMAAATGQVGLPEVGLVTNTVQIGARGDDKAYYLQGTLDEVAFYNGVALAPLRVAIHFAAAQP